MSGRQRPMPHELPNDAAAFSYRNPIAVSQLTTPKRKFRRRSAFPKVKVGCCLSASVSLIDWEHVMLPLE